MITMKRRLRFVVPVLALAMLVSGYGFMPSWFARDRSGRSRVPRFRRIDASRWTKPLAVVSMALILTGCGFMSWLNVDDTAIAQTAGLSYAIVDTGQEKAYDNASVLTTEPSVGSAFYGQDAQIDGNQPSYQDNGDGTVTDLVTGLMWQQGYSGKMSQSEAAAGASSFELAGYTDWRLPSIKELYSLIDFSGEDVDPMASSANKPFIDTGYFAFEYGDTSAGERIIDSQWATTSLYVAGDLMFGVNFADGRIKGYGLISPRGGDIQFFVRYVRGNTAYGENSFIDNGDGTITDRATGLMWSKADSGIGMDWEEALAYVQDLNAQAYLGYSDWTLPNAKELQSIVDYSRSPDTTNSAAIDPIFTVTSITNEDGELDWGYYWTGTTHASARGDQAAVYVAFGRGLGYMNNRYVDVHGAGCQRSDPKSGSAIPTGRGPQGDTVRVQNFVRVVRIVDGTSAVHVGESAGTPSLAPVGDEAKSVESSDGSSNHASTPDTSLGSTDSPNSNVLGIVDDSEYEAYVLFAPLGGQAAYLVSRDGTVIHDWSLSGRPGNSVYLLEGGDLLATYTIRGKFNAGGVGGGVELLTWDGEEVWSFELATDHAHLHHDVEMLPNGNVLMISWEAKTKQEALAAGLSANQLPDSGEVWSEMILEYDPDLDRVVWEWHLWDHVLPEGWDTVNHPEKIDLDFFANPRSEDWWHFNAVDYSAELDQIVISSRAASEIWIIDHDTSPAASAGDEGDLLYRFGNPAAYGGSGAQVLVAQHDSEWIGNDTILVFDNGDPRTRAYSRVVELDLPAYGASLSSRVLPATIAWQYPNEQDVSRDVLFADHISGAQRLANGNTLICSGTEGRFFEVTPDGEIVWEYTNPFYSTGPNGKPSNEVFRAEAYSADFIGRGLDITSLATPDSSLAQQPASLDSVPGGASSAPQNVASDEQAGIPGPPGIESIVPSALVAGLSNQMITISLDPQFAPPALARFTCIEKRASLARPNSQATGSQVAMATAWNRSGLTIEAEFTIPSQLPAGTYPLTGTFPGREGEPITFRYPVTIG